MKLLFKGPRPIVVLVKTPEFFLRSIGCGETVEVSEQVGYAILQNYGADFERIEKVEKRTRKVVDDSDVKG